MNLCLRVRVLATRSSMPGLGHYLRESLPETREVKKSIDCPQEDHSWPACCTGHLVEAEWLTVENELPALYPHHPFTTHLSGNFRIGPRLPNKPITRAN